MDNHLRPQYQVLGTHAHAHTHARARAHTHTHTHSHSRTQNHVLKVLGFKNSRLIYTRTHTHTHIHTIAHTHPHLGRDAIELALGSVCSRSTRSQNSDAPQGSDQGCARRHPRRCACLAARAVGEGVCVCVWMCACACVCVCCCTRIRWKFSFRTCMWYAFNNTD